MNECPGSQTKGVYCSCEWLIWRWVSLSPSTHECIRYWWFLGALITHRQLILTRSLPILATHHSFQHPSSHQSHTQGSLASFATQIQILNLFGGDRILYDNLYTVVSNGIKHWFSMLIGTRGGPGWKVEWGYRYWRKKLQSRSCRLSIWSRSPKQISLSISLQNSSLIHPS